MEYVYLSAKVHMIIPVKKACISRSQYDHKQNKTKDRFKNFDYLRDFIFAVGDYKEHGGDDDPYPAEPWKYKAVEICLIIWTEIHYKGAYAADQHRQAVNEQIVVSPCFHLSENKHCLK